MSGAPAAVLTRTVNAAEVGNVRVVDATPLPLTASAYLPEALRSYTERAAPETAILSASTPVVEDDVAALLALLAAICGSTATRNSRRTAPNINASALSAGTAGEPPLSAVDSEDTRFLTKPTGTAATGGDTTRAAVGVNGSTPGAEPTTFAGETAAVPPTAVNPSIGFDRPADLMAAVAAAVAAASAG